MNLADLTFADQVLRERLGDPALHGGRQRTALAREVALRVVAYRAEHGLTQTELGHRLGMKQPAIARLEAGTHEPSLTTLQRLARTLGMAFHIDITPDANLTA